MLENVKSKERQQKQRDSDMKIGTLKEWEMDKVRYFILDFNSHTNKVFQITQMISYIPVENTLAPHNLN